MSSLPIHELGPQPLRVQASNLLPGLAPLFDFATQSARSLLSPHADAGYELEFGHQSEPDPFEPQGVRVSAFASMSSLFDRAIERASQELPERLRASGLGSEAIDWCIARALKSGAVPARHSAADAAREALRLGYLAAAHLPGIVCRACAGPLPLARRTPGSASMSLRGGIDPGLCDRCEQGAQAPTPLEISPDACALLIELGSQSEIHALRSPSGAWESVAHALENCQARGRGLARRLAPWRAAACRPYHPAGFFCLDLPLPSHATLALLLMGAGRSEDGLSALRAHATRLGVFGPPWLSLAESLLLSPVIPCAASAISIDAKSARL